MTPASAGRRRGMSPWRVGGLTPNHHADTTNTLPSLSLNFA